jgi:transposase
MQAVRAIGLDIAKSVFQVHGIDSEGKVVVRRQLKRFFEKLQPCLIGIEACASSHHWSRELRAIPPAYVRPYVKRQKNDAADAEAICEAVTRANTRFVETKTPEQQSCLMLHRTRHLFIRQQTAVINAIRAHLAEFGIVAPVGRNGVDEGDCRSERQAAARGCTGLCRSSCTQLRMLKTQILQFDRMIMAWHRSNEMSQRLDKLSGVGPAQRPHWLPASPIQKLFDQDGTSRHGSGWCRSRTRAEARTNSAVSANKTIAICAACSQPARSL